jgi:hypothetical protein
MKKLLVAAAAFMASAFPVEAQQIPGHVVLESPFRDGIAVARDSTDYMRDHYYLIDTQGKQVSPIYRYLQQCSDGSYVFAKGESRSGNPDQVLNWKYGRMQAGGKEIWPARYGGLREVVPGCFAAVSGLDPVLVGMDGKSICNIAEMPDTAYMAGPFLVLRHFAREFMYEVFDEKYRTLQPAIYSSFDKVPGHDRYVWTGMDKTPDGRSAGLRDAAGQELLSADIQSAGLVSDACDLIWYTRKIQEKGAAYSMNELQYFLHDVSDGGIAYGGAAVMSLGQNHTQMRRKSMYAPDNEFAFLDHQTCSLTRHYPVQLVKALDENGRDARYDSYSVMVKSGTTGRNGVIGRDGKWKIEAQYDELHHPGAPLNPAPALFAGKQGEKMHYYNLGFQRTDEKGNVLTATQLRLADFAFTRQELDGLIREGNKDRLKEYLEGAPSGRLAAPKKQEGAPLGPVAAAVGRKDPELLDAVLRHPDCIADTADTKLVRQMWNAVAALDSVSTDAAFRVLQRHRFNLSRSMPGNWDHTPVAIAVEYDNFALLRLLVENGAVLNMEHCSFGLMNKVIDDYLKPAEKAKSMERKQMYLRYLLDQGLSFDRYSKEEQDPIDVARHYDLKPVIKLLKEYR